MPTRMELRRSPSRAAFAGLRDALLPGGRVGTVRRLRGGISNGMHAVDLIDADGGRRQLVVRRYPDSKVARRPEVAEREFRVLSLLRDLGLPTPEPVWFDNTGEIFGGPAVVMTRLPGRGLIAPRNPTSWLAQLAQGLASVHLAPIAGKHIDFLPSDDWLQRQVLKEPSANRHAKHPDTLAVWSAMRRLWPRVTPVEPAIVHGDFWAGNTLWRRERLVGIVDWDGCALGDPRRDVGYFRMDVSMMLGAQAPDIFLREYERATGHRVEHLPFWDLLGASWAIPEVDEWVPGYWDLGRTDITAALMHARLRAFVTDALARAG